MNIYLGIEKGAIPTALLSAKSRLMNTDLSLISWLAAIGREQFTLPFEQKALDLKYDKVKQVSFNNNNFRM